ncbi:helix-turn-helix transcriptional regulator [Streptomyces sp900116325]|uniref:helix-turn-helix domain-containing protein n=1 Tax=Streptomyces sp. 900116325 TaxID=3154295 RepID=UPI0033BAD373
MATPEAAEFAALLKELKDRSGRSYGVLAGRLHVSTSTLHRYCNGDAVPNEYAPVERLARLCAATPDELVELHRRWIVAEAARRRTKAEAATPVPAPVSEAVAPSVPPAPAPAVDDEKDADEGPEPGTVAAEGASPRWFRSAPRMRVLLAAAAVVALTVPTTLVVSSLNLSGSNSDLSDAPAEVDGAGGDAPELPDVDASKSASPRAHKPSGTPSNSGTPSASSSGGAATSGGQGAGAGKQGSGGAAPDVTISSYNWEAPCGQHYLLDQKPDAVPPPPAPQDTRGWARALGGVDGGDMLLELTVQGRSGQAVVLHGLHVRVLSRKEPLAWSAYSMGEGCGGGITPQSFDVDLDDNRPTLTPVAGEHAGTPVPPKDFPFRVTSTDVEVFDLDAHVEGHDVSWYLELEWSSGGRDGTLRIDDSGKPFRTSSIKARPQYFYVNDTARWSDG